MNDPERAQELTSKALFQLPNKLQWSFGKVERQDANRAQKLENVGSVEELISQIVNAMQAALGKDDLLIGLESHSCRPRDQRVVIQFYLGRDLYNWFFNGRTGYRAHFYADYRFGLELNEKLVKTLRNRLHDTLPDSISVWEMQRNNTVSVSKSVIINSLECRMSKLWYCTKFIDNRDTGNDIYSLTSKISLCGEREWAAPDSDEAWAWLDLKGAFLSHENAERYQSKGPVHRAKCLQEKGEA